MRIVLNPKMHALLMTIVIWVKFVTKVIASSQFHKRFLVKTIALVLLNFLVSTVSVKLGMIIRAKCQPIVMPMKPVSIILADSMLIFKSVAMKQPIVQLNLIVSIINASIKTMIHAVSVLIAVWAKFAELTRVNPFRAVLNTPIVRQMAFALKVIVIRNVLLAMTVEPMKLV
jgi:hypothetical protein